MNTASTQYPRTSEISYDKAANIKYTEENGILQQMKSIWHKNIFLLNKNPKLHPLDSRGNYFLYPS